MFKKAFVEWGNGVNFQIIGGGNAMSFRTAFDLTEVNAGSGQREFIDRSIKFTSALQIIGPT